MLSDVNIPAGSPERSRRGAESSGTLLPPGGADRPDSLWYALPVLPVVGIFASAFALATAPSNDGGIRSVDSIGPNVDRVFAGLNRPDAPGCVVGVFQAGQILSARGYGSANLDEGVPLTAKSIYNAASIAKQFTAAAVILLAQDGKLSLEQNVRKYVPELPDYGHPITLRNLLNHTSGIRDVHELFFYEGFENARADEVFAAIARQRALNFVPGTDWSYSNAGYALLAFVVSRVSEKPLPQFARERIFEPLGMQHTILIGSRPSVLPHRALGYTRRGDGAYDLALDDGADDTGPGGLWTSIEDLARWDKNFYDPQVGGQKLLAELRRQGRLNDGSLVSYAAGLDIDDRCGLARERHGGDDFGFHSAWVRYPTERLSVVVACNFEPADPTTLAEEVTTALLGPCKPAPGPSSTAPSVSVESLASVEGRYVSADTLDVRVLKKEGDKLLMEFPNAGISPRELVAIDGKTFTIRGRNNARYAIEPATRSSPACLIRTTGHAHTKFVLTQPYRPQPRSLAEYAGRYASDSVQRDMEIVVQSDQLLVRPFGRLVARRLVPVIRDGFVAGETAFLFRRDARNRVNTVLTRSERVRRLEWKRR